MTPAPPMIFLAAAVVTAARIALPPTMTSGTSRVSAPPSLLGRVQSCTQRRGRASTSISATTTAIWRRDSVLGLPRSPFPLLLRSMFGMLLVCLVCCVATGKRAEDSGNPATTELVSEIAAAESADDAGTHTSRITVTWFLVFGRWWPAVVGMRAGSMEMMGAPVAG